MPPRGFRGIDLVMVTLRLVLLPSRLLAFRPAVGSLLAAHTFLERQIQPPAIGAAWSASATLFHLGGGETSP